MEFLKNWVLEKLLDQINEINREAWKAHRTQASTWQKNFTEDFRLAIKDINENLQISVEGLNKAHQSQCTEPSSKKFEVAAMIFKDIHNTMDYTEAADRAIDLAEIFIKRYEGREK